MIYQLTKQLHRDEGEVKDGGKHVVYEDHLGYATLGYGRLVDHRRGGGITDEEADYLLANDIQNRKEQLSYRLPWFGKLNEARQGALINMAFQLGVNGLLAFKQTLALLQAGKYQEAARECLRSNWANQTPQRAQRVAKQIETGKWQ